MTTVPEVFIGIDVSKHQLDIAVRPGDERWTTTNTPEAFGPLIKRLQARYPRLIVLVP